MPTRRGAEILAVYRQRWRFGIQGGLLSGPWVYECRSPITLTGCFCYAARMTSRAIYLALTLALVPSCGGRTHGGRATADGGASGGPCSGAPAVTLNGEQHTVAQVSGQALAMGCCDGFMIKLVSQSPGGQGATLQVMVKSYGGSPWPDTMDLANPPKGIEVNVSYQPCAPAVCSVMYNMSTQAGDSFSGQALFSSNAATGAKASLCLTGTKSGNPNFSSVKLWTGEVDIR